MQDTNLSPSIIQFCTVDFEKASIISSMNTAILVDISCLLLYNKLSHDLAI